MSWNSCRSVLRVHACAALIYVIGMPLAWAAPPVNDDFDFAVPATEPLPFVQSISTAEATTAGDDPNCVGQGPTVWYAFTPRVDMRIQAHTFGSVYDTTLSAYTGSRGNLNQIACNDDTRGVQSALVLNVLAGQTVYFMVGAFFGGPGGDMTFTIQEAPPPLSLELRLDAFASVDRADNITVRGSVYCSTQTFAVISGSIRQQTGRFTAGGFYSAFIPCLGETRWEAPARLDGARFAAGRVKVSGSVIAFDPTDNSAVFDEAATAATLRPQR